jgi:hypothetical protein
MVFLAVQGQLLLVVPIAATAAQLITRYIEMSYNLTLEPETE